MYKIIDCTDKTLGQALSSGDYKPSSKESPEQTTLLFTRATEKNRPYGIDMHCIGKEGSIQTLVEFDGMGEARAGTTKFLNDIDKFEDPAWSFIQSLSEPKPSHPNNTADKTTSDFQLRQFAQQLVMQLEETRQQLNEIRKKYYKAIARQNNQIPGTAE